MLSKQPQSERDMVYVQQEIIKWIDLLFVLMIHSKNTYLVEFMMRDSIKHLHDTIKEKVSVKFIMMHLMLGFCYTLADRTC